MQKTKIVYRFDDLGYLIGDTIIQKHPTKHTWMIPDDCTDLKPDKEKLETHFARFKDGQWTYEKIPQDAGFFIGKQVSHKSQKLHDQVLRALLQRLVDEKPETYRVIRGSEEEGLWWSVEKIPEKSAKEKALDEKQTRIAVLKSKLNSTDYVAAKIAEGAATREEYADVLNDRQAWRDEINALEQEVQTLSVED